MTALALTLFVTMSAFTGIWLIQVRLRDAGVIDFYWAPGFFVILLVTGVVSGFNSAVLTMVGLVGLWSYRLTSHLVERHRNATAEDGRYAAMRAAGGASYWWTSLFKIFLLQGLLQWMIATPIHVLSGLDGSVLFPAILLAGLVLYGAGMAIETISDRQLRAFKMRKPIDGSLLSSGLFSISRHPNYLGEMVLWTGLALVAFAFSGSMWAFAGPLLLIVTMVFVSIPLTEDYLRQTKPAFETWASRTPMLIPRLSSIRQVSKA